MTQRYATVDATGRVLGFYADDHGPTPPAGAVPISDDVWKAWIANTATQLWNGTALVACAPVAPVTRIPSQVSMAQAQIAMHATPGAEAGKTLLDDVNALVAASTDPTVQIAWARAATMDRNGRFVTTLAPALGLTSAQLDALFVAASAVVL